MNGISGISSRRTEEENYSQTESAPPAPPIRTLENLDIRQVEKSSEGVLAVSFYERIERRKDLANLASATDKQVRHEVLKYVFNNLQSSDIEEAGEMAEKIYKALRYATFKHIEKEVCTKAAQNLRQTAGHLRKIASDDSLLSQLHQKLQTDRRFYEWGRIVCGDKSFFTAADLREGLIEQANYMERTAEGLHSKHLMAKEDVLENHQAIARAILANLPDSSFVKEAFLANELKEREKRDGAKDLEVWVKTACDISAQMVNGPAAIAYKAAKVVLGVKSAESNFAEAGRRAAASWASSGANESDFDRIIGERNYRKLVDSAAVGVSTMGFFPFSQFAKASGKISVAIAKTITDPQAINLAESARSDLNEYIKDLASQRH
jgi:hypothetical protein